MRYPIYKNKKELLEKWSSPANTVLDIGYHGQKGGKFFNNETSPHAVLQRSNKATYGLDLEGEEDEFHYRGSAEDFSIPQKFDVIFALDLIEHVSNAGLFLDSVKKHLRSGGTLVITTPNCFSLFHIAGKITRYEPTVNKQHTCYYNLKTLKHLVSRYNLEITEIAYLRDLECIFVESWKKKILNIVDLLLSLFTTKYMETIVLVLKDNGTANSKQNLPVQPL